MSGYSQETRTSESKSITATRQYNYTTPVHDVDEAKYNYSSQKETTLSYRTKDRGKPVPDHIADPYAYFLKNGAAQEIERLEKEHTYPTTASTEALVGPKRPTKKATKHPPHVDNGHAFENTKLTCWTSAQRSDYLYRREVFYPSPTFSFRGGPVYAANAQISLMGSVNQLFSFGGNDPRRFGPSLNSEGPNMKYYGQKAIGKVAPNRPVISLAAFFGELREGLPSLIGISAIKARAQALQKGKSRTISSAGDEWLNLQFGIIPLMTDIRKIYEALLHATDLLHQYNDDAGNGIRRRMSFPPKEESVTFGPESLSDQGYLSISQRNNPVSSTMLSSDHNGTDVVRSFVTQSISERIWFSGSFTYYVPIGKDLSSNWEKYVSMGSKLFGTDITVEVLWQLTPWSWLLDWFFDIQSTLSAYERIQDENLVINYGYVMATSTKKSTQLCTVSSPMDKRLSAVSTVLTSVKKKRVRANPYGFSATIGSELNPMQWSILGALGFSKLL